jgi:hypothetical protein
MLTFGHSDLNIWSYRSPIDANSIVLDSMDNISISMILFPTRTILDGEIIPTYGMGTSLNKAIKADNSIPNRIIKQDNPLHLQTPMLWGRHPVMIFVR